MKYKQFVPSLLVTGVIVALMTTPTRSEEISTIAVDKSTASGEKSARSTQQSRLVTNSQFVKPITEIRRLSEIERPVRSAIMLVQSPTPQVTPSSEVVQVTGVKANPTSKGVEIILQTTKGQALQLVNRSSGNSFIAEIPNAQLRLPSGEGFTFRSEKPIAGVTEITVTNFDAKTIRVTVKGESGAPIVELYDSPNEGLIFGVASTAPRAQQGQPQTQQPQASQPESQTQPTRPRTQGDEPIELLVTGQQDRYRVSNTTSVTKTDTLRRDIPQSIQVIPQEVLRDQQVYDLRDALRNVPGVARGEGAPRGFFNSLRIRGFDSSRNNLRNGIADDTSRFLGFDSAIVERVEVLKGPGSVLYGQGALGGTLNFVTKQPLRDPYYSIEASVGNFDFYRGAIDLSGPLNPSQSLLYRLNVGAQSTESFIDFYEEQRYAISPVIAWQMGDRTKLTLEAEYFQFNQRKGEEVGLPAVGTVLRNPNGKISRSLAISEPSSGGVDSVTRSGFRLEHRFSDNWQVNSAFRASFIRLDRQYVATSTLLPDNRTLTRSETPQEFKDDYYGLDNYVVGKFATGSIKHQLVAGFSLSRLDSKVEVFTRRLASLDVFNPVYGQPAGSLSLTTNSRFTGDTLGIYIQDQITLAENFKVLLGGRFDIANQTRDNLLRSITEFQQQEAFSPRVGIVYQPITPISLYASYARSFLPAQSVLATFLPQPERGTQYEVGIKADLTERLSATFAYYDLARTDVLTTDPNNATLVIQTGKQRSRGVEFDVTGEILPGWNIIAGYAYTDARVEADRNPALVGNFINNVPKNSFNLWTSYELQSGGLQGLGFGVGLFYMSDRPGDLANTYELPSYLRTDAAIFYKRDGFRVALNFKNLFDIDYFESTQNSRQRVFYGDPFTVQGTISVQF